jgi:hypothetical protein
MERLRLLARLRWPVLAVVWLTAVPTHWTIHEGDWVYFVWGAKLLSLRGPGAGLHTFAAHPGLHMGPLSLVVTQLLQLGGTNGLARAQFLMWVLGPVSLFLLERAAFRTRLASERPAVELTTLVGGAMLLPTWAHAAGTMAHLDDVLTMSFAALAVWAVAARRPSILVVAIALAAAAKPWGVVLLPLCLAPPVRHQWRTSALAVVLVALPWLPFVLADHATITASSYTQAIDPKSGLAALGVRDALMPHWVRPAQVLGGIALAALLVRRVHWGTAVAAALAVRLALDPAVYGYYTPTFVLAALVLDLIALRRPLPIATAITYVTIELLPAVSSDSSLLARLRLGDALALAAIAALARVPPFSSDGLGTPDPCTTR